MSIITKTRALAYASCLSLTAFCLTSGINAAPQTVATPQKATSIRDIQRFSTAIGQIKNFYVEPVEDEELFENAIRGMLTGLDPHSAYLDPDEYNDLKISTSGSFGGLGIEIDMKNDYVHVVSPLDDTPAAKAGLKAGDLIIRIGQTPVKGMTLRDAVKKMRGPRNTGIKLTILRKGKERPFEVTIVRDIIKVKSVKGKILDDSYGYLRITQFQSNTSKNLLAMIKKLKKDSKGPLKGVVLDLRNNPGGLLDSAINVSDVFLDAKAKLQHDKLIVYTRGRIPGSKFEARAKSRDQLKGIPLVVLTNIGSASGSEIVAGALQDHHRAIIIGTKTFGKGSVQTVLPLDHDRGIKLTTALYYTPSGRSIQAKGIEPDVEIENVDVSEKDSKSPKIAGVSEAALRGHLNNAQSEEDDAHQAQKSSKTNNPKKLLYKDFQLHQAVIMLKAMHLADK